MQAKRIPPLAGASQLEASGTGRSTRASRILVTLLGLAIVLAGCGVPGTIATGGSLPPVPTTPQATPLPPVRFPQDEAPHRDLTEWWYYTGHMEGQDASGKMH